MPESFVINSETENFGDSPILGKESPEVEGVRSEPIIHECERERGIEYANEIYFNSDKCLYFSISIPPQSIVKVRGKSKQYRELTVSSQYHYLKHRILQAGEDNFLTRVLFIPEHTLDGNIHFHILCDAVEYIQTYKAIFIEIFNIDLKTFSIKNINVKQVSNIFYNVAYLTKDPLIYCVNKGEDLDLITFNESIKAKAYEKSKFKWIYFE